MLIIIIAIIFVILFALWIVFDFYEMAFLALINIIVGGAIILRMIHNLKDKRNIALYLVSIAVSTFLILFKNSLGIDMFSRILSKFMILEAVQILALVFLVAQVILAVDKRIRAKKKVNR